jgi:2-polyprenyl-6-methoxyphenol hydroxylase-like FAD-dependent oxidoreductase
MSTTSADVLIAGAGPAGLLLAGDLAAAGVSVTVLERRSGETNLTRAFAVHARTLEQLDARGLADELVRTGSTVGELRLFGRASVDLRPLPSRYPFLLVTPQYNVERVLTERAGKHGARIVSGAEVIAVRQDAGGVDVDVRTEGTTSNWRAGYLVGTDGVRSAVRKELGLDFPGKTVVSSVMLADVRLPRAPDSVLTVNAKGDAFAFVAPFGDGYYRVITWDRRNQRPDSAPVDLDEIRAVTKSALGTDFGMRDARWMGRFHSDERQVPRYRVGRVLLAGDAAHVHSPAGGQGMNTGLQDAANLGWKLAAVVRGRAPAGLLESYQEERHPVGRDVLRMSGGLLRLALAQSPIVRLVRGVVIATLTRFGPVAVRVRERLSGIGIRYAAPKGAHRLTGRRAPDVGLAGGGRLYEELRDGRFALVGSEAADIDGWRDRVTVVEPANPGNGTMLIRPDAYIAWASDAPDPAGLRAALEAWCGTPARETAS